MKALVLALLALRYRFRPHKPTVDRDAPSDEAGW
jgi:hypothetical protein